MFFDLLSMSTLLLSHVALALDLHSLQLGLLLFDHALVINLQGCKVSGMCGLHLITLILKCHSIGLQFVNLIASSVRYLVTFSLARMFS